MTKKCTDVNRSRPRRARRSAIFCAALAAAFALAGCGGAGEQANKMTSFSTTESAASKAELFSLPADQMSHIQIYTVAQAPLERTLRLSGAVAYNGYMTTPVITQVGGPVSRIVVTPGEHVTAGQPLLYVASPDYSLTALRLHQGARCLPARRQVLQARPGPLRAPSHRAGRSRAGRIQPHAGARRTCNRANRPFAFWESRIRKAS